MTLEVRPLSGTERTARLDDVARLRIAVFRDWPYLYDGDLAYERRYLQTYRESDRAIIVGAFDGDRLVGAATGAPMVEHRTEFEAPLAEVGLRPDEVFYCAESVLLPEYRGQGVGHAFFDLREAQARALGLARSAFCAVVRPEDHPARPPAYRTLDGFWRGRGYRPLAGAVATFWWRDLGEAAETAKPLQFWIRDL